MVLIKAYRHLIPSIVLLFQPYEMLSTPRLCAPHGELQGRKQRVLLSKLQQTARTAR